MQTKRATKTLTYLLIAFLVALLAIFFYTRSPLSYQGREKSPEWVKIDSIASLIHVGSNDSFAITEEGKRGARFVLDLLETNNLESGKEAIKIYDQIIPKENYGGEYTALQWFAQYILAPENEKKTFLQDQYVASFFDFFADNNYANLKEYLKRKYQLNKVEDQGTEKGENRKAFLEDFILFNNPRREEWEKTSKIISVLPLKPGDTVADIGSGPGYYTFKFAQMVGKEGKVFAIDTVADHLNYLKQTADKYGVKNVETVETLGDTLGLKEEDNGKVDVAFLCSLYHNIYGMVKEDERQRWVGSIKKALKKDGKLVIVDNAMVKPSELPYHGPYVAKELIIGQMKYYGFELEADYAFIPQRYVLVFKQA